MTQTFTTNADQDIFINSEGLLSISTGLQAVLEACETASYALLGEMIFSSGQGLPYFQTVWVGSPNYAVFRAALIATLLGVDGVLDVPNLSLQVQSGTLTYRAIIKTKYGQAELTNG